jgi:glycosyltransferase involved in cell wall biosynthesis
MHVLFVTSNKDFFNEDAQERLYLEGLIKASEVLHIVVITKRRDARKIKKIGDRAWIYPTNSRFSFLYLFDLIHVIRFQLVWQGKFRAHIVHSDDPGIVGWAGMLFAYWYQCVWIVNVRLYYWRMKRSPLNRLALMPKIILFDRAYRVCVFSELTRIYLSTHTSKKAKEKIMSFPQVSEGGMIQQDTEPSSALIYPEFKFTLLVISESSETSHISLALDILLRLRQNRNYAKAGLVVVGRGLYKIPLKIRAGILGLNPWVVFENPDLSIDDYVRAVNIFLYLSGDKENEDAFLHVAVAHCAMIALDDEVSRGVITDGANGYLISPATVDGFVDAIIRVNETPGLREQFKTNSDMRLINRSLQTSDQIAEELRKIWEYTVAPEPIPTMPILKLHPLYPKKIPPTRYEKTRQTLYEIATSPWKK